MNAWPDAAMTPFTMINRSSPQPSEVLQLRRAHRAIRVRSQLG
jgi:hypothetical protein